MNWWRRLWNRSRLEAELEKELAFHLDRHAADLELRGRRPDEARRIARQQLGGRDAVKELCRDARGVRWLEDFARDLRYALRGLRQRPGFAAASLLTLALGTGGAAVMFAVVHAVLLKPLPYADPARLLALWEKTDWKTPQGDRWTFTYPNLLDAQKGAKSIDITGAAFRGGTVTQPGQPQYVESRAIAANLFAVLGVPLARGRAFSADEDRAGGPPVAIISYDLWQRLYNGDPSALGARLVFDGASRTIVAVAPAGFRLNDQPVDVFTPLSQDRSPRLLNRGAHMLLVWARLAPGAVMGVVNTELAATGRSLAQQFPETNRGRTFFAEPLKLDVSSVSSTLWLLCGAVGLLLLIACANIASLLLAQAIARERELAMRLALGAGRARLIRQCLTESALLGVAGGALGLALAAIGIRPFILLWPGTLPRAAEVALDWRVLAFALAASLACGLLFGLAPALRLPVRNIERTLRSGGRSVGGSSRHLHGAFVAAEVAVAVVLLICAGMLGRTLMRLAAIDPGVDVRHELTARMALSANTLASPPKIRAAWDDILARAAAVPGVEAVATVDTVPMREGNNVIGYSLSPAAADGQNRQPQVQANSVSPGYLEVMGIALHAGRFFAAQDRINSLHVAVVDDVMAQQAFGGANPIGRQLWIGLGTDPLTIVGVVAHVRYWGPAGDDAAPVRAQLYYPVAQVPDALQRRWSELMSIAVRTRVDPASLEPALRRALRGAGGDQALYEVQTMEQISDGALARQRFLSTLFAIFAGLALLLAAVGIYGVLAYLTRQRIPEIGVRIALGATRAEVMALVVRQSLGMLAAGLAAGLAGAYGAAHILKNVVAGFEPAQPGTVAAMVMVFAIAALAASYAPARRASRVDPMRALRQD